MTETENRSSRTSYQTVTVVPQPSLFFPWCSFQPSHLVFVRTLVRLGRRQGASQIPAAAATAINSSIFFAQAAGANVYDAPCSRIHWEIFFHGTLLAFALAEMCAWAVSLLLEDDADEEKEKEVHGAPASDGEVGTSFGVDVAVEADVAKRW